MTFKMLLSTHSRVPLTLLGYTKLRNSTMKFMVFTTLLQILVLIKSSFVANKF